MVSVKQENAHLSKKDADLFYKLYFGLLQYTNEKYNIRPSYNVVKKKKINPSDLTELVDKFWKCKDTIIDEFCSDNPYSFSKDELDIIVGFKKGFRNNFIIVGFTKEYTILMYLDKAYMIKGITSNIDETFSYTNIPSFVETSIMPFKGHLIYDGLLYGYPIDFGPNFSYVVNKEYSKAIKCYHL